MFLVRSDGQASCEEDPPQDYQRQAWPQQRYHEHVEEQMR